MTIVDGKTSLWVRRFNPTEQARTRLICFPHAGGSASFYFPLSQTMPASVDVVGIQYPGRQDRRHESPIDDIGELADRIAGELEPWTDLPVALFGHSLGATLAFEVARRLERDGTVPLALFASGRRAPSRHRDERVHQGDDDDLLAQLKKLNGTDAQVFGDEEVVRMIMPALRSDYRAAETYRYRPGLRLNCPIFALTGDDDSMATVEEVCAWSEHTTAPFELRVYPGGHFFLTTHAASVRDLISEQLAKF
ncbi:surfactin synthase thioesterase subunit [Streptosporangium album]|uniref:Surfactin synthase thioesterase subunit n=1 Tax=Streptosporangium album TaxID=47479 RepID=A0A7W7WF24_9ACTN|nr:thioesterase II family protein [Streptosporangium album]MBB4944040.1 surfactin synthase thioesterase subunit [Streptosporangium album]